MIFAICLLKHALSSCKIEIDVSKAISNPQNITCHDDKTTYFYLTSHSNYFTAEKINGKLTCSYSGDGCDGRIFHSKYYSCNDNEQITIIFEKYDIPSFCFSKNPYIIIKNEVDIKGFEVIAKDTYNDSFLLLPNDSEIVIQHPSRFYVDTYFKSDLCNLNKLIRSDSAQEKGNTITIKESKFLDYCQPLRVRFIFNFPDFYQLMFEVNPNNITGYLESNKIYYYGFAFNMSVYVSMNNKEKIKIDKNFTGSQRVRNYELTEMDIPEEYRIYKIDIQNNIDTPGCNVYAKIIGDEKSTQIEKDQVYSHSDTKKFIIEIYTTNSEDGDLYYCKTIASSLIPKNEILTNSDINSYHINKNITITNNVDSSYKIYAIDNIYQSKIFIPANETIVIERKEDFEVNITVQMDACISGEKVTSLKTNYGDLNYNITYKRIPSRCSPYLAVFNNSEPDNYQFYYTLDFEDDLIMHDVTNETVESGHDFSLSLYVTSGNKRCNKQRFEKTFSSSRYLNAIDLIKYIPNKCKITKYKVLFKLDSLPEDSILQYSTSMNSTLITASETIDLVSEEKFDVNLFITYKYCKSVFLNTYEADPYFEPVSIKYIPKVCNEENQKYHAIYNLSQIPSDYSIEYQILDYTTGQYSPSKKAVEEIDITQNSSFSIKIILASSPGCSNYTLLEEIVTSTTYQKTVYFEDIPLKCRIKEVISDNEIRENDIFDVIIEHDDESTEQDIRDKVKEIFNDNLLWENDPKKDKVVLLKGPNKLNYNMNLEDNEYIKLTGNKNIGFNGGNLNILLDHDRCSVSMIPNVENLKIKGSGDIDLNSDTDEINISSGFILDDDLEIYLGNARTLNIDSVDIYQNARIYKNSWSETRKMNINKLNVKPGAEAFIDGLNLLDTVTINQPGTLKIDSSNINNASFIFNLKYKTDLLPLLQGDFFRPPKSLLVKNEGAEPEENQSITLISSDGRDFLCQDWLDSLVLDGSGYNDKECIATEHFRAYSVSHVLKIRKIKKEGEGEGDGDGDDNSKPNKKGGLNPGVIAAIVIVVIVVVAAIIVVVFIVLRRKKNNNNSESENEGNAEDI